MHNVHTKTFARTNTLTGGAYEGTEQCLFIVVLGLCKWFIAEEVIAITANIEKDHFCRVNDDTLRKYALLNVRLLWS